MSDEGDPKKEPVREVSRRLLHVRYVFGYLGSGFLVSVPISLGMKIGSGLSPIDFVGRGALSVAYGIVLLVPFFALWPVTRRFDWKAMNVPEFQLFELAVTRASAFAALGLFLLGVAAHTVTTLADPSLAWTVFVLMFFAWGRIKVQTRLFPEFYASEKKA